MAKTNKARSALPYVQRLLEDEYVQEQLRDAAAGLRNAYGRAARKRAQAAEDKKLYGSLRRAVTSLRNATIALRRREPPPKHRGRKLLIIALAAGATAQLTRLAQKQRPGVSSDLAPPSEAGTSTGSGPTQPAGTSAPS